MAGDGAVQPSKSAKRFQDATKKVQQAIAMGDMLAGWGGPTEQAPRSTEVLALAQLQAARKMELQEQALADEARKDQITNLVLLVLFFDMLGPVLMMSNTPSVFGPPPPNTTQAQLDGGTGIFFLNGDVPDFPIGKGEPDVNGTLIGGDVALQITMSQAMGSTINALCAAISASFATKLSSKITIKGTLMLFMFGGSVAFSLAGLSRNWDSMYLYWAMNALMGFMGGSQTLVTQIIQLVWADDKMKMKAKTMLPMNSIIGAVAVGPAISGLLASDDLFLPLFIGAGMQFCGGVLVLFRLPNLQRPPPPKKPAGDYKKTDGDGGEAATAPPPKPPSVAKWLSFLYIARFFDSIAGGWFQMLPILRMPHGDPVELG